MAKTKMEGFKTTSKEQKEFLQENLYNKFPKKFQAELLRRVSLKGLEMFLRQGILEDVVSSEWDSASSQDVSQVEAQQQDLIKKVDSLFIEGTHKEKLNFIVEQFFKWHEKFPYLTIERTITPEDAGFLPNLPCVKAIYWEDKFLGFQCIMHRPPIYLPRISLKDSQGHRITLKITTEDLCLACVEMCKKHKVGMDLFKPITLENIFLYKKQRKEQQAPKHELTMREKLQDAGLRMNVKTAKGILKIVRRHRTRKRSGVTKASNLFGVSRPTIYKLLEVFPEGVH